MHSIEDTHKRGGGNDLLHLQRVEKVCVGVGRGGGGGRARQHFVYFSLYSPLLALLTLLSLALTDDTN